MGKTQVQPDNWKHCDPFIKALVARQYVRIEDGALHLCMADGIYLYLYELWRDGVAHGEG